MEWLKKILEDNGVTVSEDLMSAVTKELPKHFMPKSEYNLKLDEIKGLREQIETRDNDIKDLKKAAQGNDELKNKYTELERKYNSDTTALKDSLNNTKRDSAIELMLSQSGAKSIKALKGLIDMDKVKYENDTLSGLSEQIETIKKDCDYLFGTEPRDTGLKHGNNAPSNDTDIMSVVAENQVKRN